MCNGGLGEMWRRVLGECDGGDGWKWGDGGGEGVMEETVGSGGMWRRGRLPGAPTRASTAPVRAPGIRP